MSDLEVDLRALGEVSEKDLSQHVVNLARMLGWKVHRVPTWRSTGADSGFPDIVAARDGEVIFIELKAEKGKLSAAQEEWAAAIGDGAQWFCIRPSHWYGGLVEAMLR